MECVPVACWCPRHTPPALDNRVPYLRPLWRRVSHLLFGVRAKRVIIVKHLLISGVDRDLVESAVWCPTLRLEHGVVTEAVRLLRLLVVPGRSLVDVVLELTHRRFDLFLLHLLARERVLLHQLFLFLHLHFFSLLCMYFEDSVNEILLLPVLSPIEFMKHCQLFFPRPLLHPGFFLMLGFQLLVGVDWEVVAEVRFEQIVD